MSQDRPYEGQELELFAVAKNWKGYWSSQIKSHLGKSVLEVGAGLGANTPYLIGPQQESWLGLEPDAALCTQISTTLANEPWRGKVRTIIGFLKDVPAAETFDTLLYIDVLEHIEDDHAEMCAAFARLKPGGKVIVLSPAHPALYTPFDKAIGHFRRYTRKTLRACTPPGAKLVSMFALDSVGLMASVANKLFLHQSMPTVDQVKLWDTKLVPLSRLADPVIGYGIGKSLIAIWQKPV